MAINLDDAQFQTLTNATIAGSELGQGEVRAIIDIVQLAGFIDLTDAPEEELVVPDLVRQLCTLGGLDASSVRVLSPVPTDEEERASRFATIVPGLASPGARALAYSLAYLTVIADTEIGPAESTFIDELRIALALSENEGAELAGRAAELVTPG